MEPSAKADVYDDDGMRASFITSFLCFIFLSLLFASLASRANHTHPITAATPGVCCMNTSEFGISSPGFFNWHCGGRWGVVSFYVVLTVFICSPLEGSMPRLQRCS